MLINRLFYGVYEGSETSPIRVIYHPYNQKWLTFMTRINPINPIKPPEMTPIREQGDRTVELEPG